MRIHGGAWRAPEVNGATHSECTGRTVPGGAGDPIRGHLGEHPARLEQRVLGLGADVHELFSRSSLVCSSAIASSLFSSSGPGHPARFR
jgi:hypothetical protein